MTTPPKPKRITKRQWYLIAESVYRYWEYLSFRDLEELADMGIDPKTIDELWAIMRIANQKKVK